jgi:shikimate kinase
MDSGPIEIVVRRRWRSGETLFMLGPGGVGKSTLGHELGLQLGWPLIDLDFEFCEQLGRIGPFIATHGYERYRAENLALAERLVATSAKPSVFVTSSGFLAAPEQSADRASAQRIIATGYGVTLLPSLNVDTATEIVVARQLTRGFGLEPAPEELKFRERFQIYRGAGETLVVSTAAAVRVAGALLDALLGNANDASHGRLLRY